MDCNQAGSAMMQYADKCISKKKARALHKHVQACASCQEYFLAFDEIIEHFNLTHSPVPASAAITKAETDSPAWAMVSAPDDFTDNVMAKINRLHVSRTPQETAEMRWDKYVRVILGICTVMAGIAFILTHNREVIHAWLLDANAAYIAEGLNAASLFLQACAERVSQRFQTVGYNTGTILRGASQYILIAAFGFTAAFVMIHRKEKEFVEYESK